MSEGFGELRSLLAQPREDASWGERLMALLDAAERADPQGASRVEFVCGLSHFDETPRPALDEDPARAAGCSTRARRKRG